MGIDVTGINLSEPTHHGYAVVGTPTVNFYQSRATASGVVSAYVLHKPTLSDYVDKYETKFTGINYYQGQDEN